MTMRGPKIRGRAGFNKWRTVAKLKYVHYGRMGRTETRKHTKKEKRERKSNDGKDEGGYDKRNVEGKDHRRESKHKRHRKMSDNHKASDSKHRKKLVNRHVEVVDKTDCYPLGHVSNIPVSEDKKLDPDMDYFSYHSHFRLYLYRKGSFFEDLSSDEARHFFREFCRDYNSGRLEQSYYTVLPVGALAECKRTKHKWNFRVSEHEHKTLDIVTEGVRKQTEYEMVMNKK